MNEDAGTMLAHLKQIDPFALGTDCSLRLDTTVITKPFNCIFATLACLVFRVTMMNSS
jgi:hypothetical protein